MAPCMYCVNREGASPCMIAAARSSHRGGIVTLSQIIGFLTMLLLFSGTLTTQDDCARVDGIDRVLADNGVVILGEIHGTSEAPVLAGTLVCHGLRTGRSVILFLELPETEQPRLDRYLQSEGRIADQRRFLEGSFWIRSYQDGRTSTAMLNLIDLARKKIAAGASLSVVFMDRPQAGRQRDRVMADNIIKVAGDHPDNLLLILTGNLHARVTPGQQRMARRVKDALSQRRVVALNLRHSGGTAWLCLSGAPCGSQQLRGRREGANLKVELSDLAAPHYDGWFEVGPITASQPAATSILR